MSSVLAAAVRMDFHLQRRYGFWYATAFVVLLWIGVLQLVPDSLLGPAMPYLLMADLEFMLFFIAGAVFFEKGERTVFALLTTPLRFRHYLTAKLLTMSALALVTCVVVVLVDYSGLYPHPAFSLVPTHGPLLLLGAAFDQVALSGWQWIYAIGYPALWIAGLCLLAKRVFHRYVVTSEGGR